MKILSECENKRFYEHNNHLFYYDHECMAYLGEKITNYNIITPQVKYYKTGALVIKYYGYEKVSHIAFWTNDGKCLFNINTDNLPFDINLYKSKADNINAITFDDGVFVSMRNADNQSKYIYYFYDKTYITGYNFEAVMNKAQTLSKPLEFQNRQKPYTDMILNQLNNNDNLEQTL